ncbi:protein of unknown function [Burkholderia multivorans]
MDGFTAKVAVRVKVKGKWKKTYLKVIFAVSRNSHAVLGVEIVLKGESAVAFRRCIASCFLDKTELAKRLGLESAEGLPHGNIDGAFVDNGAGASEENAKVACQEMRLSFEIAPPGRGDYKTVGENLNSLMVRYFEEEPSGHNRRNDKIDVEERRRARRRRGASLRKFIEALYKAVQHHNLEAFRPHLRSHEDFIDGEESSPCAIFNSQQSSRRGDARRSWTEREILARCVPWKRYRVRRGLVHFKDKCRYTSPELTSLSARNAQFRKQDRRPLFVSVKRLSGSPQCLIWKNESGEEGLLKLIDEDTRRIQDMSWAEFYLTQEVDSGLKGPSARSRRATRNKLTIEQHEQVGAAERARAANGDTVDLEGESVSHAKEMETQKREREQREKEAAALGIGICQTVPAVPPRPSTSNAADDAYAARYRAKKQTPNPFIDGTHH